MSILDNLLDSCSDHASASSDFLVVEWTLNKVYTILQNAKSVRPGDLVTCRVNDLKDTGKVLFIGSERDCRALLERLERAQIKKRRKKLKHSAGSKLNLPGAIPQTAKQRTRSATVHNDLSTCMPLNRFSTMSLPFRDTYYSRSNSNLNSPTRSIKSVSGSKNSNKRKSSCKSYPGFAFPDHFETSSVCLAKEEALMMMGDEHRTESSDDSLKSSSRPTNLNGLACTRCHCCLVLMEQMAELNQKLAHYERTFFPTPEVISWLESVKHLYLTSEYRRHLINITKDGGRSRPKQGVDHFDLSTINSSLAMTNNAEQQHTTDGLSIALALVHETCDTASSAPYKIPEIVIETV